MGTLDWGLTRYDPWVGICSSNECSNCEDNQKHSHHHQGNAHGQGQQTDQKRTPRSSAPREVRSPPDRETERDRG